MIIGVLNQKGGVGKTTIADSMTTSSLMGHHESMM